MSGRVGVWKPFTSCLRRADFSLGTAESWQGPRLDTAQASPSYLLPALLRFFISAESARPHLAAAAAFKLTPLSLEQTCLGEARQRALLKHDADGNTKAFLNFNIQAHV